ncbi:hypothetical protein CRUP_003623, partial [Coryphaenoides rupestris]
EPPGAGGKPVGGQRPPVSFDLQSLDTSPFPALSEWGQEDGATAPFVPDLLLAEVGPDMMSKPEGPEVVTEVPGLSQDPSTERTMSSEDLPLIFDPFDDVTPQGVTAVPPGVITVAAAATPGSPPHPPPVAAMATGGTFPLPDRLVTAETDGGGGGGPSHPPPLVPLMPEWQASGTELPEPRARPSVPHAVKDSDRAEKREEISIISGLPTSTLLLLSSATPVTTATHRHVFKSTSGLEEMESEVRNWMELLREKAGYVSGMLVPVGIGIAGAILIVGALYSVRMIHRRRRNSFKYQRRKQPRESGPGRPDQAMLLADSSEDEF